MKSKKKLIRITTVPLSLDLLLTGQLSYMNQFFNVTGVSSDAEYLERVGKKEGIRVHAVEMTRQITPIQDLKSVWQLYRFLKKEKPFIVHTHTPKAGIIGMLAARLAGVPNRLHDIAGLPLLEARGVKRHVLEWVEKMTYALATKAYPNSFEMERIIIELGLAKPSKLKVLGQGSSNGNDTQHFSRGKISEIELTELRSKLGLSADDFVFIFVGRMVRDKGINELVSAFVRLAKEHSKVKLLLVGDYEAKLDPLLPQTIESIQSHPSIIEAGFQRDVRPFMALSHALAFPSYREGFPNVVMEAAAMDLPCVVSDINGCNEIITHYENGLIVPPKDEEALYKALETLVLDEKSYLSFQSKARASIESRYEQKQIWHAIHQEYASLE